MAFAELRAATNFNEDLHHNYSMEKYAFEDRERSSELQFHSMDDPH